MEINLKQKEYDAEENIDKELSQLIHLKMLSKMVFRLEIFNNPLQLTFFLFLT